MRLNWAERLSVNNPLRVLEQRLEIHRLKKMMTLKPGFIALEMGCGRGAAASIILREFQPSHIHAQDLDLTMIDKAKKYLSVEEKKRCSLFVGDAAALPVKTGSFDVVFGFGVLHHIPDWRAALAEVARVLKPGGVYFLEDLYPSLYQNFITKHILLHPTEDRFFGRELKDALAQVKLPLAHFIEFKRLGILGAAVKEGSVPLE
jgi:ubiquinone/menaquinone biosynthesis C-methylase UbiE